MSKTSPYFAVVARTARKSRWCPDCRARSIKPGDRYLEHKEFPGGEAGYADAAGHPVRMPECGSCARRNGRGLLLDGVAR